MEKYGTSREQLAMVAVKNHHHGTMNPLAQFPFEITVEAVLNSVLVADPLRMLDCSPITDGAAAVVLCPAETARKRGKPVVKIIGTGQATDTIALSSRKDITWLEATYQAAKQAYAMADKKPEDIDLAEVHDCFTIAEWLAVEDLGLVGRGEAPKAYEEGLTQIDGEIPVNTSGGLKAKGHPVGATGIGMLNEVWHQLRGTAGRRQVKNKAEIGLIHNVGGSGASAAVFIFGR